jgi:hypothetical protein
VDLHRIVAEQTRKVLDVDGFGQVKIESIVRASPLRRPAERPKPAPFFGRAARRGTVWRAFLGVQDGVADGAAPGHCDSPSVSKLFSFEHRFSEVR